MLIYTEDFQLFSLITYPLGEQSLSKTHTGKCREYRKNGDIYVLAQITAYDPQKKRTVTVKEKLPGKIILAQWIDSHSIAQIFGWFDCIETTTIKTDAGAHRWSTESVAGNQKFLEMLNSI